MLSVEAGGCKRCRGQILERKVVTLRQDDFLKGQLVLECWRQGCMHGNHQVPVIILGCLANRQKLGWGNFLEILKGVPKFSATLELPNRDKFPDIWNPNFVRLLHAVDSVYDGSMPDPAFGGVFWATLPNVDNPWFIEKVLNNPVHSVCANQGPFTVFR